MRTDDNLNPTAFTVNIAQQAGLVYGTDYEQGTPFESPSPEIPVVLATYYTAKLLGDPVALTIKVINSIGFYTKRGSQRWVYIGMPSFVWDALGFDGRRDVIGFMYQHEGGATMRSLFPNYGAL